MDILNDYNVLVMTTLAYNVSLQNYVLEYTYRLEKVERKGHPEEKFLLTIWPDHCLIGSEGHAIQEDIQFAVREWDIRKLHKVVKYIYKVSY